MNDSFLNESNIFVFFSPLYSYSATAFLFFFFFPKYSEIETVHTHILKTVIENMVIYIRL